MGGALAAAPALVVTSPPYPMIGMWDESFSAQSDEIRNALAAEDGQAAFDAMHGILDEVWRLCHEMLVEGGLVCVNIGDAVRTVRGSFRLYPNAARALAGLEAAGFTALPPVVWRKPTNSPTKFMGSGMLPGGAYVTLEHEMILIARKGGLRRPRTETERARRRRSAIFWEERNEWYSDLWMLKGVRQALGPADRGGLRERSAAFPLEIAYRLIAMHSWMGDLVVDPFAGTGTTAAAAAALARSSLSLDRDPSLVSAAARWLGEGETVRTLGQRSRGRLSDHGQFVRARDRHPGHLNRPYGFPVVTSQETDLEVPIVSAVESVQTGDGAEVLEARYESLEEWREESQVSG